MCARQLGGAGSELACQAACDWEEGALEPFATRASRVLPGRLVEDEISASCGTPEALVGDCELDYLILLLRANRVLSQI